MNKSICQLTGVMFITSFVSFLFCLRRKFKWCRPRSDAAFLYEKAIIAFQMEAAQENGSEQQLQLDKDVLSHPPSSAFFSKGLCLMLWKDMMMVRLAQAAGCSC